MELQISAAEARAIIQQRIQEGEELKQAILRNSDASGWANKVEYAVQRILGDNKDWTNKFVHRSGAVSVRGDALRNAQAAQDAVGKTLIKLQSLLDIIDEHHADEPPATLSPTPQSNRVFVVHGHDDYPREAVTGFLRQLGFEPVVLHEQPNMGRTIIEKVEACADVGFAVVLLTPDDLGKRAGDEALEPRARQNVLLELGYFIGRLTRQRVCALKRGDVAIPSDFAGVVYHEFDSAGAWKTALGGELEAAGYDVDWNLVMRRGSRAI